MLEAYSLQFQKDFSVFLKCRSEELVSGGRMVLSFLGRSTSDPTTEDSCYHWDLLAQALMTMVSEVRTNSKSMHARNYLIKINYVYYSIWLISAGSNR